MVKLFVYGILMDRYPFKPASLPQFEKFTRVHATIRKHPHKCVTGQIIDVSENEFKNIDLIESYPSYYVRFKTLVEDDWGNEVEAWVYQQREDYEAENGDFVTDE